MYTGLGWEKLEERDKLEYPGADVGKILRWIFGKWDAGLRTGSMWFRTVTVGGNL